MGNTVDAYRNLGGKPEGKRSLRRLRCSRRQCNIKVHLKEMEFTDVDWINLVQDGT
jgi:hypothetical protein